MSKNTIVIDYFTNPLNNILPKKPLHEYGVTNEDITSFTDNVIATQGRLTANNFVPLSREDIVYSDEVIRRFAALKPAAEDFRIFWDNAYCVHNFDGECAEIPDIISEAEKAGNEDIVYEFCSTSKITFPGAGISAVAASPANLIDIRSFMKFATIGPDKLNQLRHARYFKNSAGLRSHMKKHGAILKQKFDAMYEVLEKELGGLGIADWTHAKGGYFSSFSTMTGCAKQVVDMCAEYGVKFTPAGATYPHGCDPENRNIRLAPSFATVDEIKDAVTVLSLCTKVVSIERLLNTKETLINTFLPFFKMFMSN